MAPGQEQGAAFYGQTLKYFRFSFSINLFAIFGHTESAPKSRGDQDDRKAQQPHPPPTHTHDAYLDEVRQDTSQNTLSLGIREMQNAARSAYLSRLCRISDRASLKCLEKATKARLDWAARLDRESLEKLDFATKMLEKLDMKTPPEKERWQYNARSLLVETEASSSSESKRIHSIQDSPCEAVLTRRRPSVARPSGDLDVQLDPQHERNVKDEMFDHWMQQKQNIGRVVEECDIGAEIDNPFGALGKDLDGMMAESEGLKSMSPVKVQESEDGGEFIENPLEGLFNSKQEAEGEQEGEGNGSVELDPEFADSDQEREDGGTHEDAGEEWTDLGEATHLEKS
ncbi:hypothetical protein AC579_1941 [Pseudocercospora musae]|uniref:Uncharacterized protein n=1 Tax=Pseudocercospora musae TaxID=113226 RepID=A0A139I800_9PEZI|nr:hypothetical protein AC579_1941 [Pseudocercospora musae]